MTRRLFAPVSYTVLTVLAAACLVPFVWMALTALKPADEVFSRTWLPSTLATKFGVLVSISSNSVRKPAIGVVKKTRL